jgi:predicted metal-binding membrane protein
MTATLGLAAASWVVAVQQMNGMDMGVATQLGSFAFFVALWVSMMAAMMLPGAAPAVLRLAHANGRVRAVLLFVGSYLAVWTLVGVAVYALYRPHGSSAAGALAIAAGVYEFTPLKQHCRRRCRESVRSGFEFGL